MIERLRSSHLHIPASKIAIESPAIEADIEVSAGYSMLV
jgi:hypothetical protein